MKFLLIFLIFFTLPMITYGKIQVTLNIGSTTISMNEIINFNVKINGSRDSSTPIINNNSHFNISSNGSSKQIQMINGNTSILTTYHYTLRPLNHGTFTLGPAKVIIKNSDYLSNKVTIQIVKAKAIPKSKRNYFLEASTDKKNVFLGDKIIYSLKLYYRVQLYNSSLGLPGFDNFQTESLGDEHSVIKIINGVRWKITELKYILIPKSSGQVIIPPAKLEGKLVIERGFFNTQTRPIQTFSNNIKINVMELPQIGKPDLFNDLVGQFKINTTLEKNNLKQGESTTLTITVSGIGDVQDLEDPHKPDTSIFKVYNDKPIFKKTIQKSQLKTTKIFKKAIIPLKQGILTIPPIKISYFDTTSKTYKTISSQKITINVSPSDKIDKELKYTPSQPTNVGKRKIKLLGKDLMPNFYNTKILNGKIINHTVKSLLYILNIFLPILYLTIIFYTHFSRKRKLDTGRKRRSNAYHVFSKKYKKLKQSHNPYHELTLIIKEYLGDKLEIDGRAITSIDLQRILPHNKIDTETMIPLKEILIKLDGTQFGGIRMDEVEKSKFLDLIHSTIKKLEKEI